MVMNREKFHDYVVAHGHGSPTAKAYALGASLIATGDDYATAAAEVVSRGLTIVSAAGPDAAEGLDRDSLLSEILARFPELYADADLNGADCVDRLAEWADELRGE
jgi:hypothetical protein